MALLRMLMLSTVGDTLHPSLLGRALIDRLNLLASVYSHKKEYAQRKHEKLGLQPRPGAEPCACPCEGPWGTQEKSYLVDVWRCSCWYGL